MFKLDLEKAEEPEIKLPSSTGSSKKTREFQKNIYFCFIDYTKRFDYVNHNKVWKILQEMGIPDHLTCSWEICMHVKKQQLELDMEQWTGSKLGKEYVKAVCCHPVYLTYMQNISFEMLGWMKPKLESRLVREQRWHIRKDPDAGKYWKQEKKGTTKNELVGWHHWLNGHKFDQALGDVEAQGISACCRLSVGKESDMTEQWTITTAILPPRIVVNIW